MLEKHSQEKINDVTKAVAAIYNRIDTCINSDDGFCYRVSECQQISTESAMDLIMSDGGEAYEFISRELVDEAVELIMALYWAREYGKGLAYPMPSRNEPHREAIEFNKELKDCIKNVSLKAETENIRQNTQRLHKAVTDFGEWVDGITANPLGVK